MNKPAILKRTLLVFTVAIFVYQVSIAVGKLLDRPTVVTTKEKSILDTKLPMITICPLFQYNVFKLKNLGYVDDEHFASGILNESHISFGAHLGLSFPDLLTELLGSVNETAGGDLNEFLHLEDTESKLTYLPKFGYCAVISQYDASENVVFAFQELNGSSVVFVTDTNGASEYNLDYTSQKGDRIILKPRTIMTYRISMELVDEKTTDTVDCDGYEFDTLRECSDIKSLEYIDEHLDCYPPWILNQSQCNDLINNKTMVDYLARTFYDDILHPLFFYLPTRAEKECRQCIISSNSHVKLIGEDVIDFTNAQLTLVFDKKVKTIKTVYAYSVFNLLIDIGGSMGLWLGWSVYGFSDTIVAICMSYKKALF